ncbi:hypothetical protein BV898_16715 [Hypsibius exemplaris]|uniref:Putative auto-transporter adhesin head GIN domain-containing protein n=1 Tax=Hypsibius exemplaris TaxID=2072580 RepID=A0A9X6NDR1_HYPEX|nr:hypothetical protein BV898_16715 [Hypsibius exemplaris]
MESPATVLRASCLAILLLSAIHAAVNPVYEYDISSWTTSNVIVFGGLKIHVEIAEISDNPGVAVKAPTRESIEVRADHELTIRPVNLSPEDIRDKVKITIRVRPSKHIRIIVNDGSTVTVILKVHDQIEEVELLALNSQITATVAADLLSSTIEGAGIITLDGSVRRSKATIKGSGIFNALDLAAKDGTQIRLQGSGVLNVWTPHIDSFGSVDGSGFIVYKPLNGVFEASDSLKKTGNLATVLFINDAHEVSSTHVTSLSEKEKVVALLKSHETGDPKALAYLTKGPYTQHDLDLGPGVQGVIDFVTSLHGTAKAHTVRVFQDGNYVFAHSEYEYASVPYVGFDIFRFEHGVAVEHWDNLQVIDASALSPGGHTMIDGPTQATDLRKTENNKALARQFFETVLVGRNFKQLQRYFAADVIEHIVSLDDGLVAVGKFLAEFLLSTGEHIQYLKVHLILGEGDFVLVTSEGLFQYVPTAYYDLLRFEEGKIAEHWNVLQTIPPKSQWKNDNGKF